jgi:hypothetical protein
MNGSHANPNDLQREVQPFLRYDETLLWTGRPGKISSSHTSLFLPIFAIFWMGFAVFWTITATAASGALGLFGVFFIFMGGFLFYNAFFGKRNLLKNAIYAVTDQRALIITYGRYGTDCTEYLFSGLRGVNLESVQGNVGTIRFAEECPYEEYGSTLYRRRYINQNTIKRSAVSAFFMIENVHQVHHLISDQLDKH